MTAALQEQIISKPPDCNEDIASVLILYTYLDIALSRLARVGANLGGAVYLMREQYIPVRNILTISQ